MHAKLLFGWTLLMRVCMAVNLWTVLCQLMSPLSVAAIADYGQRITYLKMIPLCVYSSLKKNFVDTGPLGAMVDGAKERWREALKSMRNGQQWAKLSDLNEQCLKQLMRYNVFSTLKTLTVISIKAVLLAWQEICRKHKDNVLLLNSLVSEAPVKKLSESLMQTKLELM